MGRRARRLKASLAPLAASAALTRPARRPIAHNYRRDGAISDVLAELVMLSVNRAEVAVQQPRGALATASEGQTGRLRTSADHVSA
jgi:hypothetical protein